MLFSYSVSINHIILQNGKFVLLDGRKVVRMERIQFCPKELMHLFCLRFAKFQSYGNRD